MTKIYGIWDVMSTIDCIMEKRVAMSLKARFRNGAWRLIVVQIIFGLRSRHDRFLPAVRRIVACAVFTSRPFAFGRCRLGTAQAQARHARHLQPGFGPTQVASASWLGPINLRGHRLRRGRPRAARSHCACSRTLVLIATIRGRTSKSRSAADGHIR